MSARADPAGLLATYGTALAAAILFLIFAVAAPNFLNPTNLLNVLKQISFLAILGLGFGLALITGELDLSFANVCSFAAVVVGGLIHHGYSPQSRSPPAWRLAPRPARSTACWSRA
jgi:ribose transport system permease protein